MTATRKEIVRSYRTIYRHALHAVQFSTPSRYTVKTILENAYRTRGPSEFNNDKINNTIMFLQGAASEKGMEHRILKSLLHTWWWENESKTQANQSHKFEQKRNELSQSAIDHFEITLKMLNESMGMCLPTSLSVRS